MKIHEIVVGNIGSVYLGNSTKEAQRSFDVYCDQSQSNYGRAAGENVTWFKHNEIYKEFIGSLELSNITQD